MTATTTSEALAFSAEDYAYSMRVNLPPVQIIDAVTNDAIIRGWWTVWTDSASQGDEVQLFMDGKVQLAFTIEHAPGTHKVTWTVTNCGVIPDWVGTKPSFSVQPSEDGSCVLSFHHIGLRPALECFDQCRAGWDHFMPSLHQFLEVGEGLPNEPRQA